MKLIRRILLTLASLALLPLPAAPQSSGGRSPAPEVWPTGTFSILAYDPTTGELGGAVQSRVFSVGKNVFAYTGPKATVWAGNKACTAANTHCTAQGNILAGPAVVDSMVAFFERTPGHLAYRLLAALEGGQLAGGDKRGQESAALVIVKKDGGVWLHNDTVLRLQVDDNPEPIKELRRLVEKAAAQEQIPPAP